MTNEDIFVKLYSLIPNTHLWLGQKEKEYDQKLEESPISSEKCLSQETREPLGAMSHRERL